MRLPRALNPNENPAQFGIFFSANRLKKLFGNSQSTAVAPELRPCVTTGAK
ncbi:MAG: hypothetical protein BECKG1743E_GA0114224_100959, partial [Candidatus Kentron sp. G]